MQTTEQKMPQFEDEKPVIKDSVKTETDEQCTAHANDLKDAYFKYRLSHKQDDVLEALKYEIEGENGIAGSLEKLRDKHDEAVISTIHEGAETYELKQLAFPDLEELIADVEDASLVEVACKNTTTLFGADPDTGELISEKYPSNSIEVEELAKPDGDLIRNAKKVVNQNETQPLKLVEDLLKERMNQKAFDTTNSLDGTLGPKTLRALQEATSMGMSESSIREFQERLKSTRGTLGDFFAGTRTTWGEVDQVLQTQILDIENQESVSAKNTITARRAIRGLGTSDLHQLSNQLSGMILDNQSSNNHLVEDFLSEIKRFVDDRLNP